MVGVICGSLFTPSSSNPRIIIIGGDREGERGGCNRWCLVRLNRSLPLEGVALVLGLSEKQEVLVFPVGKAL